MRANLRVFAYNYLTLRACWVEIEYHHADLASDSHISFSMMIDLEWFLKNIFVMFLFGLILEV